MPRIPPRIASKMSVTKALNALAGAGYVASKGQLPEGGGSTPGVGDMEKSVYDPTNQSADIFDYADQSEADAKSYTDTEISTLSAMLDIGSDVQAWSAILDAVVALGGIVKPKGVQLISSIATTTYTKTSGTTHVLVYAVGAGGSGGAVGNSAGTGIGGMGGRGGAGFAVIDVSGVSSVPIQIGTAGSTTAAGNNDGNTGTDTTWDSPAVFTAAGGVGGVGSTGATTGSNGTNGSWSGVGTSATTLGQSAIILGSVNPIRKNSAPFLFTPQYVPLDASGNGNAAGVFGAGGFGGYDTGTTSRSGGAGGNGFMLIIEFGI